MIQMQHKIYSAITWHATPLSPPSHPTNKRISKELLDVVLKNTRFVFLFCFWGFFVLSITVDCFAIAHQSPSQPASAHLLGGRVLGHSLGALRHSVLGQLARQQETHGSLDLARRDGALLVVLGQARRLVGNALKDIIDKRVHDAHGLGADASVGVDLLEHLVDVDRVRFFALVLALLVACNSLLLGGRLVNHLLGCNLGSHL